MIVRPATPEDHGRLAEIWLRCVVENSRASSWYEREGFLFEGEETVPPSNLRMRRYRWKRT